MILLCCILIVAGIAAMVILPQIEDSKHRKIVPVSLGIGGPLVFILLMVFLIIRTSSK